MTMGLSGKWLVKWYKPHSVCFFHWLYSKSRNLLVLSLCLFTPLSGTAQAVTEIQVTQKIPGPPLWEIRYQGNTVWLFPDISPMAEGELKEDRFIF